HPAASDRNGPDPDGRVLAPVELTAHELVRLQDPDDALDAGHRLHAIAQEFLGVAVADDSDHDALHPLGDLATKARLFDRGNHRIDLRLGVPTAHDHDHYPASSTVPENTTTPRPLGTGGLINHPRYHPTSPATRAGALVRAGRQRACPPASGYGGDSRRRLLGGVPAVRPPLRDPFRSAAPRAHTDHAGLSWLRPGVLAPVIGFGTPHYTTRR